MARCFRTPQARPVRSAACGGGRTATGRAGGSALVRRSVAGLTVAVAASASAVACSSGDGAAADDAAAPAATVMVSNMAFSPAEVTVHVGDTVTWKFRDNGIQHDVTSTDAGGDLMADPVLDSGERTSGEYSHTFTDPGTYDYICVIHPQMTGEVVVEAAG